VLNSKSSKTSPTSDSCQPKPDRLFGSNALDFAYKNAPTGRTNVVHIFQIHHQFVFLVIQHTQKLFSNSGAVVVSMKP